MDACNLGALGTPDNVSLSFCLSLPHRVDVPNFGPAGGGLCPGALWYQLCVCR
jgi:hypothetical protein